MSETPVFDRSMSANGTNGGHTGHDQRGRFAKGKPIVPAVDKCFLAV